MARLTKPSAGSTAVGITAASGARAADAIEKLGGAFRASLESSSVKGKLLHQGSMIVAQRPAEFAKTLERDIARWKIVIETAKIQAA